MGGGVEVNPLDTRRTVGGLTVGVVVEQPKCGGVGHLGVVLEGKLHSLTEGERRVFPADLPDDGAGGGVEVVDGRGVAHRDDHVTVGCQRDRVDVVRVVDAAGVVDGVLGRDERVGDRNMLGGMPIEEHLLGGDVDLLDHRVVHGAVLGAADRGQVGGDRLVDGDPCMLAVVGESEFVDVGAGGPAGMVAMIW